MLSEMKYNLALIVDRHININMLWIEFCKHERKLIKMLLLDIPSY